MTVTYFIASDFNLYGSLTNIEIYDIAESQARGLRAYVTRANLGFAQVETKLYDGEKVALFGQFDFDNDSIRDIYERSKLLQLNDIYQLAVKRGLGEIVSALWGEHGLNAVQNCDLNNRFANKNHAPV